MFFHILFHKLCQRLAGLQRHCIIGTGATAADKTVTADADKACSLALSDEILLHFRRSQIKSDIHITAGFGSGVALVKAVAVVDNVIN